MLQYRRGFLCAAEKILLQSTYNYFCTLFCTIVERFCTSDTTLASIIQRYKREFQEHGCCSADRLASLTRISKRSAKKAIDYYHDGYSFVPIRGRGHGRSGVGSLAGMTPGHHVFLYQLYMRNPSRPLVGYRSEFFERYGLIVSEQLICRWFKEIGPFSGSFRETSAFPPGRWNDETFQRLRRYLQFVCNLSNSLRLVFADEKPMKERDIFRKMRRNVRDGSTPQHSMNANSRNRYNILAAVTIKEGVKAVEYAVLQTTTTAPVFLQFVKRLLQSGTLTEGDVL